MEVKDDFSDVINKNYGVFGAEQAGLEPGLQTFEAVESKVTPDGVIFEMRCHGCGHTHQLLLEYPEVIALKHRLSPHIAYRGPSAWLCHGASTWLPEKGVWKLQQPCRCGWKLRLQLNKNEPDRLMREAARESYLNDAKLGKAQAHCQAIYQRMMQQRRG